MFSEGLEKVAGLKHWATAGLMALSHGHKAKAADMLDTVRDAASKTQVGKELTRNSEEFANKLLRGSKKVTLVGDSSPAKAGAGAAQAAKKKFSLDIEDARKLKAKYGPASAELSEEGAKGRLELPKGFDLSASSGRGGSNVALGFKKEF